MTVAVPTIEKSRFKLCSASQIKSFIARGPRYWYLSKILKLPEQRKGYFGFGTTLHEVLERWLSAEANGRDADGTPIELYPESFEITEFGRPTGEHQPWDFRLLEPAKEGQLIRELVEEAVEKGLLSREADRCIEWSFTGEPFVDGVRLTGFVDWMVPSRAAVIDHKSVKNKRYRLSEAKMRMDPQLMLYAKLLLDFLRENGLPVPKEVEIRHVNYLKDLGTPKGERVSLNSRGQPIFVTVEHVEEQWQSLVAVGHDMVKWSKVEAESWDRVPCKGTECARMYGGCPFATICSGQETPEKYKARQDRIQRARVEIAGQLPPDVIALQHSTSSKTEKTPMSLLADLKKRKTNGGGRAASPQQPANAEPEKGEEGSAPVAPPWRYEDCPACGGSGWNTKGCSCRICKKKTGFDMKRVKVVEGEKVWDWVADKALQEQEQSDAGGSPDSPDKGTVEEKETAQESESAPASSAPAPNGDGVSPMAALIARKKAERNGGKAGIDDDTSPEQPATEPEKQEPETPLMAEAKGKAKQPEEPKRRRGRPKGSKSKPKDRFILLFGAAPSKVSAVHEVINLSDLLTTVGAQLAEALGADSYYALGAFDRRDNLARRIEAIIDEHIPGEAIVFTTGLSPDENALAGALSKFATTVIHAVK